MFGIDNPRYFDLIKRYPIPYMSYSQLSSFRDCPESFRQTYMGDKFERRGNKYTELGGVLHDLFERQAKQLIAEAEPFSKGQAIKQFNKDFLKVGKDHKDYFEDKEDFIKMYQKGIQAIENYYEVYSDVAPIFVEKKFMGKIAEDLPPVKSFIDRIDGDPQDPSSWILSDYKTGNSPKSKDYLKKDFQLGLYVAQVFAQYGAYPKAVQFVHPVPQKTQTALHLGDGVYKFQGQRKPVVEFSVADTIVLVRETVADIVEAKETGNWVLKPDSWSCKMCFHYQAGTCQPFNKQQEGWANI